MMMAIMALLQPVKRKKHEPATTVTMVAVKIRKKMVMILLSQTVMPMTILLCAKTATKKTKRATMYVSVEVNHWHARVRKMDEQAHLLA